MNLMRGSLKDKNLQKRSKTKGRFGRSYQIQHQGDHQLLDLLKNHLKKKTKMKKLKSKQSRKRSLNRSSLKRKMINLHGGISTLVWVKMKTLSKNKKSIKRIKRMTTLKKLPSNKNKSKRGSSPSSKQRLKNKNKAREKLRKTKSMINHGGSLALVKTKKQKRRRFLLLILKINSNNPDLNRRANELRLILISILM